MLLGVYTHIDNMVSLNLLFSFVLKVLLALSALLLFLQTCLFGNGARHHFLLLSFFQINYWGSFLLHWCQTYSFVKYTGLSFLKECGFFSSCRSPLIGVRLYAGVITGT